MKNKKQQQTSAVGFLKNLRLRHRAGFNRVSELLEKFDLAVLDSGSVFRGMVREFQGNDDLLDDFNDFLADDHRVREVSCDQIAELFSHVYGAMQRVTPDKVKFMRFLNVSDELGKTLDDVKVMSLEELGEMILAAVNTNASAVYWGQHFLEALDETIKEYIAAQTKVRKESGRNGQAAQPLASDRQPSDPSKSQKPPSSETGAAKSKGKQHSTLAPTNGSAGMPATAKPAVNHAVKEVPAVPAPEEPQQFNLRVEAEVILALKAQLSPDSFVDLVKSLQLFTLAVISYQELMTMNERSLMRLDKAVCLALREMVESRMAPAQRISCFNIRLATIRSEDTTHNRKYFRIVSQIAANEQFSDGLINKSYVAIASGHESAGNLDDPVSAKVPKNSAEQILFKVEDEMHEADAVLAQFRVARGFLERMTRPEVDQTAVDRMCHKIGTVRTLSLLYGSKGPAVLEEVRKRQPQVLQIVRDRLAERIEILEGGKRNLVESSWLPRVSANFYKGLDQRTTSLKVQERNGLHNKSLVEQLKSAGNGGQFIRTWLSRTANIDTDLALAATLTPTSRDTAWNPVFVAPLDDPAILAEAYNLLKVYGRQAKFNASEKSKISGFLEKAFMHYFGIPKTKTVVPLCTPLDSLGSVLAQLEKAAGPPRQFYYSDKVALRINQEASQTLGELIEDLEEESEARNGAGNSPTSPPTPCHNGDEPPAHEELTSSDKDEPLDQSDVSKHFKKLIESNGSVDDNGREMTLEFVDVDASRRVFYASYHFYVVYQYFVLLYERLRLAHAMAQASPAGLAVFTVFRDLLYLNLFGVVDEASYEDGVRMLFGPAGGVLLNFERILGGCLKHVPSDEFSNFVLSQNGHLFGERTTGKSPPEAILFARTCFKLNEMSNKDNKGYKVNSFSSFNSNYNLTGSELVKFEFLAAQGVFVVHKVRSLFPDPRKNGASNQQLVDTHYSLLTHPVSVQSRRNAKGKRLASNSLTYVLDLRRRALQLRSGDGDDLLLAPRAKGPAEPKRLRILKKNKDRFREVLRAFRDDKN